MPSTWTSSLTSSLCQAGRNPPHCYEPLAHSLSTLPGSAFTSVARVQESGTSNSSAAPPTGIAALLLGDIGGTNARFELAQADLGTGDRVDEEAFVRVRTLCRSEGHAHARHASTRHKLQSLGVAGQPPVRCTHCIRFAAV